MKVCIVTQSKDFASSAGGRIRYQRLINAADQAGISIDQVLLDRLGDKRALEHDLYVFVKTPTAQALVASHRIRQSGGLVAVDIFDDYFSQEADPRLEHSRAWLAAMDRNVDFYLCSSAAISETIRCFSQTTPIYLVRDAAPEVNPYRLAHMLQRKVKAALDNRKVDLLWFGMGDNPYFPVGIQDLVSFGRELTLLTRDGWHVELTVLTNKRALTPQGLAQLRRLPVPCTVDLWSVEREQEEIERNFACYLPVSCTNFSRAKSLNRATSALAGGCQILTQGYALYRELGDFIVDDPAALLSRLDSGQMPLRLDTIPVLTDRLLKIANCFRGLETLIEAVEKARLLNQPRQASGLDAPSDFSCANLRNLARTGFWKYDVGVIHGRAVAGATHKMVTRLGGLSVKSLLSSGQVNFHIRIEQQAGEHKVLIDADLFDLIPEEFCGGASSYGRILQTNYVELDSAAIASRIVSFRPRFWRLTSRAAELAAATDLLGETHAVCQLLFPATTFYFSENDPLFATREIVRAYAH